MRTALNKVPINQIFVNMKVISARGTIGYVSKVEKEKENNSNVDPVRFDRISIDWLNGKQSTLFHIDAEEVTTSD